LNPVHSRPRHLTVLLPLVVVSLALAMVAGQAVRAARPAAPFQAAAFPLSPEEAVTAIRPLQLQTSDLPEGYGVRGTSVDTPASEAIAAYAQGVDPYAVLQASEAEGTQACSEQQLSPPSGAIVSAALLRICLMSDAASAQRVVQNQARMINTGTVTPQAAPVGLTLGDGSPAIYRVDGTDAMGNPSASYRVRWSRGITALELVAVPRTAQADATGPTDLAQRLDAVEATRGPVTLPQASVPAPVTEAQRVYQVIAAQSALHTNTQELAPDAQPFGRPRLFLPADNVLQSSNPQAALMELDQVFQRVGALEAGFSAASNKTGWNQTIYVDGSAQGAFAELTRPNWVFVPEVDSMTVRSVTELTPPIQLGDATRARKIVISSPIWPDLVNFAIAWTHGSVVLQATIANYVTANPQLSDDIAWAQLVERDYQASALPVAVAPQPTATPAPGPTPPPDMMLVDRRRTLGPRG
jgi:hypothetical protein